MHCLGVSAPVHLSTDAHPSTPLPATYLGKVMASKSRRSSVLSCLLDVLLFLAAAGSVCCASRAERLMRQPGLHAKALDALPGPAVAVLNGVGFHTEVYSAVLWSLVQANASVSAFVITSHTSGIEDVIGGW